MEYSIVYKTKPTAEEVSAIATLLQQFNFSHGPDPRYKQVELAVQAPDGTIAGGLWGRCGYGWLFVEYLIVPEDARHTGLGTALMQQAEQIARDHGCTGIWLNTLAFQARPFYEKLGYNTFGVLPDFPPGGHLTFLQKRLTEN